MVRGESGSSGRDDGGVVDTISHRHGPRHEPRQQLPLPHANQGVHFISKVVVRDVGIFHRPNDLDWTRHLRVSHREKSIGALPVFRFQLITCPHRTPVPADTLTAHGADGGVHLKCMCLAERPIAKAEVGAQLLCAAVRRARLTERVEDAVVPAMRPNCISLSTVSEQRCGEAVVMAAHDPCGLRSIDRRDEHVVVERARGWHLPAPQHHRRELLIQGWLRASEAEAIGVLCPALPWLF